MADTMRINAALCNVVYIEAGGIGDGTTPATPLGAFPAIGSLVSNTVFIVRRNTTGVSLPNGTRNNLNNIFFLGMPKSTDWIYGQVPAAVKASAWDSDVADYARVEFATYNATLILRPIVNAGMHRCHVVRMNPAGGWSFNAYNGSSGAWDTATANLLFRSSDDSGNYFFTNNKWTDDGIELSNPAWTTNTTTRGANMHFGRGKVMVFRDNHIEFNLQHNQYGSPGAYNYEAVSIQTFAHADVCGNTLWISSASISGIDVVNYSPGILLLSVVSVNFIDNTVKLVVQATASYVGFYGAVRILLFSRGIIKNCDVSVDRYYNPALPTQGRLLRGIQIERFTDAYTSTQDSVTIQNISIDGGKLWYTDYLSTLSVIRANTNTGTQPYTATIENITAKFDDAGGFGTAAGLALYLLTCRECNTVTGIVAHHYTAEGLHARSFSNISLSYAAVIKDVSVKGKLTVYECPFMEVTDVAAPSVGEKIYLSSSVVYIATATYDNLAWVTQNWVRYIASNSQMTPQLFIDNINLQAYVDWQTTPLLRGGIWLNNVGGIAGNWYGSNRYYVGTSNAVNRTGGGAACVKFVGTYSDTRIPLEVGPVNFKGLQWVPPTTGDATAKFYLAHVNSPLNYYTAPQQALDWVSKRIRGEVLVPYLDSDGQVQYRMYSSDLAGMWEDDVTSVWNNTVEPLIPRMCTIPFKVEITEDLLLAATPVQFRLYYDLYGALGFTYFDPVIVFGMS